MIHSGKKRYIIGIVCLVVALIGIICYLFYPKSPRDIFHKTVNSIVEVKASDNKQKSFGTAVFIGKKNVL